MTYVVVENTPGYLPDDDEPATFETLAEARAHARDLVAELREGYWSSGDRCAVRVDSPSAPRLWTVARTTNERDLGRAVEIMDAAGN
jgi:hypothetical protein